MAAGADPGLVPALLALAEPDERGDPCSPLRWTLEPARKLAAKLTARGHRVSADTAGDPLHADGFRLGRNCSPSPPAPSAGPGTVPDRCSSRSAPPARLAGP